MSAGFFEQYPISSELVSIIYGRSFLYTGGNPLYLFFIEYRTSCYTFDCIYNRRTNARWIIRGLFLVLYKNLSPREAFESLKRKQINTSKYTDAELENLTTNLCIHTFGKMVESMSAEYKEIYGDEWILWCKNHS